MELFVFTVRPGSPGTQVGHWGFTFVPASPHCASSLTPFCSSESAPLPVWWLLRPPDGPWAPRVPSSQVVVVTYSLMELLMSFPGRAQDCEDSKPKTLQGVTDGH